MRQSSLWFLGRKRDRRRFGGRRDVTVRSSGVVAGVIVGA